VDDNEEEPPRRARLRLLLERVEEVYLAALRAALLLIATILVAAAVALFAVSIYRLSRSPSSVHESPASVTAAEIVGDSASNGVANQPAEDPQASQRRGYAAFVNRYFNLFRTQFEPFRHTDDRALDRQQFDDSYVGTQERLNATKSGKIDYQTDISDLAQLFNVMRSAAGLEQTRARLSAYKAAQKAQVCRNVDKTRTEVRTGWDRYSTTCSTWYMEPLGCSTIKTVDVPYTARECRMQYPSGVETYGTIFRNYQDEFFRRLGEKKRENAEDAEQKREAISTGNIKGRLGLWTVLEIGGGFLILTFLFLLIAIERHQRKLARSA
jgi:hypothetical protein